jgi:hypothetical protein
MQLAEKKKIQESYMLLLLWKKQASNFHQWGYRA